MRVLFVVEAVTLAHVARAHALARSLDPGAFAVGIAADPRYDGLVAGHLFEIRTIRSIPSERFNAALARGGPIYDLPTLERYVEDDLAAIAAFAPDVVVGDFRLSLSTSARLAKVPYVNVVNAGWSPYASSAMPVPDLPVLRRLGTTIGQRLFDLARPLAFALHARPMNRLRRRHGLEPLSHDLRRIYCDGDEVLYADVPALFPMLSPPRTHAFLGAVLWAPAASDAAVAAPGPSIYVTLGSSGAVDRLQSILDALADLPMRILVATAGRRDDLRAPANARIADFVDGTSAARLASLVICNGGSPTSYQALAAGVPVLGIPGNLDQLINMTRVAAFGAGLLLRPLEATRGGIASAVARLLGTPSFRDRAEELGRAIAACDPGAMLAEALVRARTLAR